MSHEVTIGGETFTWDPTKSTPSTPQPLAELNEIVQTLVAEGFESVVAFGCGRGRNAPVLDTHFHRVHLVELPKNIETVRSMVDQKQLSRSHVMTSEQYLSSGIEVDVAFLIYVLHTLPERAMRLHLLEANYEHLTAGGRIVAVVPAFDSKYRESRARERPRSGDCFVGTYRDGTASFYRNFTGGEFDALLEDAGLQIVNIISGDHRYIRIAMREDELDEAAR